MLLAGLPGSAAHATEYGVWPDTTYQLPRAVVDRERAVAVDLGARYVREGIAWAFEEPERGRFNERYLKSIDAIVDEDIRLGLEPVVQLVLVPFWASADPGKGISGKTLYNWRYHPASYDDFARFVRRMVTRYSARGVHTWEIWNEPNLSFNWPSGPNPAEYVAMLRAAYGAAKAADPGATVLAAGLAPVGDGLAPDARGAYTFLEGMLAAGAAAHVDALGYHPYPSYPPATCPRDGRGRPLPETLCSIAEIHAIAERWAPGKPMWLTEIGFSTCPTPVPVFGARCFTEAEQAEHLVRALGALASEYPYVPVAIVSELRDRWERAGSVLWADHVGLLRRDFSPKPAFGRMRAHLVGLGHAPSTLRRPGLRLARVRMDRRRRATIAAVVDARDAATAYAVRLVDLRTGRVVRSREGDVTAPVRPARVSVRFTGLRRGGRYRVRLSATNPAGSSLAASGVLRVPRRAGRP